MIAIRRSAQWCSRSRAAKMFPSQHADQTTELSCHGHGRGAYYQIAINNTSSTSTRSHRSYFTNTDQMKKSDPYAALGLTWGATATEIKDAYRKLARELHPDVSQLDPTNALNQFRIVKDAHDKLMNNNKNNIHNTDIWEEWSFAIWRNSDLIAQDRTDVAGVAKRRPVKPAESMKRKWGVASLGHPDGRGANASRGEYLSAGGAEEKRRSSTVGTGQNKWVSRKEFRPWKPRENNGGAGGLKKKKKG